MTDSACVWSGFDWFCCQLVRLQLIVFLTLDKPVGIGRSRLKQNYITAKKARKHAFPTPDILFNVHVQTLFVLVDTHLICQKETLWGESGCQSWPDAHWCQSPVTNVCREHFYNKSRLVSNLTPKTWGLAPNLAPLPRCWQTNTESKQAGCHRLDKISLKPWIKPREPDWEPPISLDVGKPSQAWPL